MIGSVAAVPSCHCREAVNSDQRNFVVALTMKRQSVEDREKWEMLLKLVGMRSTAWGELGVQNMASAEEAGQREKCSTLR